MSIAATPATAALGRDTPPLPVWELVCIVAGLMALNALAIDIMLPALADMQGHFEFPNDNDRQKVVVFYVIGLGLSQLFYGPLVDRFGRKPVLGAALAVYLLAAAACLIVPEFGMLVFARFVQGASAGATRVVAAAVVRDFYAGWRMAEIMSLVMLIFMAAPILAPSVGQGVMAVFGDWQAIFWALLIYGVAIGVWAMVRLPETLKPEDRRRLDPLSIFQSYETVFTTRVAVGYMLASACVFSTLFSYISASQQIYAEVFGVVESFPLWFAGIAAAMGASNLANSRLVRRIGMRPLSHGALAVLVVVNIAHAVISVAGWESFPVFYALMIMSFGMIGFIGPNFSASAMEPLGRLAGTAAALYGFATTFGSGALGGLIASGFDGTTAPLFIGDAIAVSAAFVIVYITEQGRMFRASSGV